MKLTQKRRKRIQTGKQTPFSPQGYIIASPFAPPVVFLALSSTRLGIPDVLPKAKCGEK